MKSYRINSARRFLATSLLAAVAVAGGARPTATAQTISTAAPVTTTAAPNSDVRYGGALAESYGYYRSGAAAAGTIAPPAGWSGYGFPVRSYRWGWFGASRYFPIVIWHRGYNGDQTRWAYRQGY